MLLAIAAPARATTVFAPILEQELERRALPALSVAILRKGEIIFARGYGLADRERGQSADERTVFPIGSVSQQFTAAAVMRLVERGTLGLDQSVASLLPGSPERWRGVTVEELLRHTSGVRERFRNPAVQQALHDLARPASELLDALRAEPLAFTPGERWAYSNSNYVLLAAIVEQLTGMRYERFLEQEFFRPHDLDIWHCSSWPDGPNEAHGYSRRDGAMHAAAPENMSWARGDAGLCASSIELARWAQALGTGNIVSQRSYAAMTSRRATRDGSQPDYGFGLSLIELDGRPRIAHNGTTGGFSATLAWYPGDELAIALLSNLSGVALEAIEKRLARAVFGLAPPEYNEKPLAPALRRRMAGTYDIGVFDLRIVERAGRLRLEMPPGRGGALIHLGDGMLVAEDEPDAVRVSPSPDDPDRIVLLMANMHWYGRRIPAGAQSRPE